MQRSLATLTAPALSLNPHKVYAAGGLTLDGYVWGSHMPEGADWKALIRTTEFEREG